MAYKFSKIPGQRVSERQAVGFLESDQDAALNAKGKFEKLDTTKDRDVRKRFDAWIDGLIKDNWFHGWPNDLEVKECWSFRWEEKGNQHNRFYGFLCNPQPKTNPRFQICVLTYHDVKNSWETNRTLLLNSMSLRTDPAVKWAISMVFADKQEKDKIQ